MNVSLDCKHTYSIQSRAQGGGGPMAWASAPLPHSADMPLSSHQPLLKVTMCACPLEGGTTIPKVILQVVQTLKH